MITDNTVHYLLAAICVPSMKTLTSYAFSCHASYIWSVIEDFLAHDDLAHVSQIIPDP